MAHYVQLDRTLQNGMFESWRLGGGSFVRQQPQTVMLPGSVCARNAHAPDLLHTKHFGTHNHLLDGRFLLLAEHGRCRLYEVSISADEGPPGLAMLAGASFHCGDGERGTACLDASQPGPRNA